MFNNNINQQNSAKSYYPEALHFNDETKQPDFVQTQSTPNNFQQNNTSNNSSGFNLDGIMNMFKNNGLGNDMLSTLLASGMFGGTNMGQQNPMLQMMSQMLTSQNKKDKDAEKKESVILSDTSFEEM